MPCPFFQPLQPAKDPTYVIARLPLIEEWDGNCHAGGAPAPVPRESRFAFCNHGYSQPGCALFPAGNAASAFRYTVRSRDSERLELLCIEERAHAPVRWFSLLYRISDASLEGEFSECVRAQARAFCISYLKLTNSQPQS